MSAVMHQRMAYEAMQIYVKSDNKDPNSTKF